MYALYITECYLRKSGINDKQSKTKSSLRVKYTCWKLQFKMILLELFQHVTQLKNAVAEWMSAVLGHSELL